MQLEAIEIFLNIFHVRLFSSFLPEISLFSRQSFAGITFTSKLRLDANWIQRHADTAAHAYDCKIVKHDMSARRFVMAMTHNLIPNLCMPVPNVVSHGAATSNAGNWRGASFGSSLSLHFRFEISIEFFD